MTQRPIAAALAILAFWATGLAAQHRPPAPSVSAVPGGWEAFTRAFDAYLAEDSIVGGAMVFVREGRIVAQHVRGMADRARGAVVDSATLFHYGSITKTLTAVAIMQLRDRGVLSLDDRVTTYLPELRQVHSAFGSLDDVTIRMLLSHSAGFQDPTWPYTRGRPWEPFEPTRWEQLVAMMPYQELRFRPGSRYGYSNPAFIYLARILEQLTGDPYQAYIYKNLWTPLGMRRSYFGATPYHLAAHRSDNYTVVRDSTGERVVANGREFDPGITIPNGGWNAPLSDLAIWARFLTGATGDDSGAARVLARTSLEEMWRPVVPVGGDSPESMGLSFFVRTHHGRRVVGHTGWQSGFRAFLYFDPEARTVVIVAVNTSNDARPELSQRGYQALIGRAVDLLAP
jgi:CubicO group peptidase (beta-lactamase class C family)